MIQEKSRLPESELDIMLVIWAVEDEDGVSFYLYPEPDMSGKALLCRISVVYDREHGYTFTEKEHFLGVRGGRMYLLTFPEGSMLHLPIISQDEDRAADRFSAGWLILKVFVQLFSKSWRILLLSPRDNNKSFQQTLISNRMDYYSLSKKYLATCGWRLMGLFVCPRRTKGLDFALYGARFRALP